MSASCIAPASSAYRGATEMRLVELDPRWLLIDGRRVGFVFKCPLPGEAGWWQSCFVQPTQRSVQRVLFEQMFPEAEHKVQGCKPECAWQITPSIDQADFDTLSVTPSLDGSAGGLWHGFITQGAIV